MMGLPSGTGFHEDSPEDVEGLTGDALVPGELFWVVVFLARLAGVAGEQQA